VATDGDGAQAPDDEIDARLAEVDAKVAAMTPAERDELRLDAEAATLHLHTGAVRRVFRRGRRIGPCLYEQGDPEPNPPVPVSSNLLHWTRHEDGYWRASNLRRSRCLTDTRYAYQWRFLLNAFPQLTEVLPGDPPPPTYRAR